MNELITITALNKQFGAQTVLNDVDLTITSEKIIGLIGPSGAGKTTLIKTTLGMEKADSGTSLVLGQQMPNRQILGQIGYMAQSDALYETLTAKENLAFFAQLKGVERHQLTAECQRVAKVVDLSNDLTKRVSGFSGGMKRRLSLAIALLGQPQLLILDEPTVGIDPALRLEIWRELDRIKKDGCGVLVTTHVMSEAEMTDSVALLMDGRIIANDAPAALKQSYGVGSIEEAFLKAEREVNAHA